MTGVWGVYGDFVMGVGRVWGQVCRGSVKGVYRVCVKCVDGSRVYRYVL